MDCPVCKNEAMVVLELDKVEIDHCLNCSGIWLDAGELELLLENEQQRQEVLNSFADDAKTKEKKRKCPICLKAMEKIICGKEKEVLIDKCRKNHGLWFDKNELKAIVATGSIDENNRILALLEDMFGEKEKA